MYSLAAIYKQKRYFTRKKLYTLDLDLFERKKNTLFQKSL